MKNKIKIILILDEIGLKRFKTVPTFKNLLYENQIDNLIVGKNNITVNHYIFGTLKRLQTDRHIVLKKQEY